MTFHSYQVLLASTLTVSRAWTRSVPLAPGAFQGVLPSVVFQVAVDSSHSCSLLSYIVIGIEDKLIPDCWRVRTRIMAETIARPSGIACECKSQLNRATWLLEMVKSCPSRFIPEAAPLSSVKSAHSGRVSPMFCTVPFPCR